MSREYGHNDTQDGHESDDPRTKPKRVLKNRSPQLVTCCPVDQTDNHNQWQRIPQATGVCDEDCFHGVTFLSSDTRQAIGGRMVKVDQLVTGHATVCFHCLFSRGHPDLGTEA